MGETARLQFLVNWHLITSSLIIHDDKQWQEPLLRSDMETRCGGGGSGGLAGWHNGCGRNGIAVERMFIFRMWRRGTNSLYNPF